jgi:acyl-coenzyme A thioesterase PaaI-like protein
MTTSASAIDPEALRGILGSVVAPWVAELDLQLRQAKLGELARVLRMGRKLVFGEIQILDARGELAAHATTTYALV